MLMVVVVVSTPRKAAAFTDGSGWAMFPYIVQTLLEAYKRYAQLQAIILQSKTNLEYLRWINAGLDQITGLMATMPIKDEKLLGDLRQFQQATRAISQIYGAIPKSGESQMQALHDDTIAESLRVITSLKDYAEGQESNAARAFQMSNAMSPKGAVRLAASTNAQILHALAQLLKVNGQMLKLKSEEFALANKEGKDSVGHFNRVNEDMRGSLTSFKGDFSFPRF